MMGYQPPPQSSLFYSRFNLEERIRSDHPLRGADAVLDLDFVYGEVSDSYGCNGNVSIPPPMIVKLMLLLVFYNVRSERELMATLPERLDWLWFLGLDLDSEIPHHSVLSKARKRWGADVFRLLFERVVWQCVEAGLVDGEKLFCDSSLVDANASCNSVVKRMNDKRLRLAYSELEGRLEDVEEADGDSDGDGGRRNIVNRRYVSTTDPEASVVRKGAGKARPRHQTHRAIDGAYGVITATVIGPGDENEAHRLGKLMDQSHANTGKSSGAVVADSKYGTTDNLLDCHRRGIKAHMPVLKDKQKDSGSRKGIFPGEAFAYQPERDSYICPAGEELKRRKHRVKRQAFEYAAPKQVCDSCHLRDQCTRSKTGGRTIKRHEQQAALEQMREQACSNAAKRDIRIRQHFMEGSFAGSTRFGYKRARWRGLWRVQIQDHLIATVQNIGLLINHGKPKPRMAQAMGIPERIRRGVTRQLLASLSCISLRKTLPDHAI
jgi:transposase